ncbi:protein of unknown function DUF323 [Isosphaera pallida ATCC 43644]|uniref:Sulfatase-modifying factor enzyme-like domain-containing protein n=1 Tax=Isosphaera pallida (strain ATCC 43644 / DSM 9630 / IS1B) TaxID=575540 RepID=E8QXK2_ISOPI|nr:SUMF1/EgtB/PvdO family nonheme iron enzyme [Isosphaera pallida]ADV63050.1 protein of unknown function DUF323 [Isosphaera pallida ATCC 43644]
MTRWYQRLGAAGKFKTLNTSRAWVGLVTWGTLVSWAMTPASGQETAPELAGPPLPPESQATTEAEMKPYKLTIPYTDVAFEMVPVKGGVFKMGSPEDEENRADDEGPQIEVEIAPFWMGKYEVTWDEYDLFAFSQDIKLKELKGLRNENLPPTERRADAVTRPTRPYADETFGLGRRNQPVICITHHAAMEYCRWLSEKTGQVYRLPTEAEWEYACRAGSVTPYSFGADPEELGEYAWYVENAEGPQKVGKKKPNAWGLFDMHGNVAEWVLDRYDPSWYGQLASMGTGPIKGPVHLPDEREYPHVVRGGSWDDDAEALRSAARRASDREWSLQDPQRPQSIWWHTEATFVGFRIVRPLKEQPNLVGFKSKVVKGKGAK